MFFQEAISYIKNIERGGSDYGIERMRELLLLLGEPDKRLRFVHVAGTNGKGSVCAYLTTVLKESGYTVGTYNSPSVVRYNERFLINGTMLSNAEIAKHMTTIRTAIESEQKKRTAAGIERVFNPTAFEIETALAFLAFEDNRCDICVLETGLGGRWDATNVIYDKELAVITNIGYDHCALLGGTLTEIAGEKAAIIKDRGISAPQEPEARIVLQNLKNGAEVHFSERAKHVSCTILGQKFEYRGIEYKILLLGNHQLQNAALAIDALHELRELGWNIPDDSIKKGLANTKWAFRLDVISNNDEAESRFGLNLPKGKMIVLDGAHNPQGAEALSGAIKEYLNDRKIHLVIGVLADKDHVGVLKELMPAVNTISFVESSSPRALKADALAKEALTVGKEIGLGDICHETDHFYSIRETVQSALDGEADVVLVAGSLTLFAEFAADND